MFWSKIAVFSLNAFNIYNNYAGFGIAAVFISAWTSGNTYISNSAGQFKIRQSQPTENQLAGYPLSR